jgi:hypothetical protein
MNTPINDGGPAFPVTGCVHPNGDAMVGMTLRDYFAGQALAGFVGQWEKEIYEAGVDEISNEKRSQRVRAEWIQRAANTSYGYADAMLAARERKEDAP